MKKLFSCLLCALMIFAFVMANAETKLAVEKENFYFFDDDYCDYVSVYAKVINIGDTPLRVNDGSLIVLDQNGETITSTDYLECDAICLQPGEYTYCFIESDIEGEQSMNVADYNLTISVENEEDLVCQKLPLANVSFTPNVQVNPYTAYDYMNATVTNDTDETIFDIYVVFALLDDEDNILHVGCTRMGDERGLMPGCSMVLREYVSSERLEFFEKNGLKPTKVDAIAYVDVYEASQE